ncbi:MAG: glycoside hydrolase family 3 C-terminal domain-containing protein, partial [Treponema sp.]|nr:glycoside hydrolase family 3 C-terminal domain-containing protein [Treponema sp.]
MTFAEKILENAQEGIVLLRNKDNVLPLQPNDTVSVFGRIQFDYYRSGTGSGGSVHIPYSTNLTDELIALHEKEHSAQINEKLCDVYRQWIKENPFDNAQGRWAEEPNSQKDMPVSEELAKSCAEVSTKAIYVIGRNSGEDKDLTAEKGSFFLTDVEKSNLEILCKTFASVIVIFNTSVIMDMSWIDAPEFSGKLKALVYTWEGGQEGGRAAASVLTGKATPSGKLTDTIAKTLNDYPATKNFGKKGNAVYQEDIFVGYRYFLTFAKDKILFPFGYGQSYTQFKLSNINAKNRDMEVSVNVTVKNTGTSYSGKEVVQLYAGAPQGKLGKSARVLTAFAKTSLLKPQQEENVSLSFNLENFASYDESGVTGNKSCFVLEQGDYDIFAGTDSLTSQKVLTVHLDKTVVTEQLEQCCAPVTQFKVLHPGTQKTDGTFTEEYKDAHLNSVDLKARIEDRLPKEIEFTGNKGITFDMLKKDPSLMDSFVAQLTDTELATMVRGEGMLSEKVTPGIAAAYGGTSEALHSYGIPCAGCSDGPSGIRMDTGTEATLMPIGTLLACTWNPTLVKELYTFEGKELVQNKIDALLGPGMNIHRHPLGGRNFEYFSEDPLVTG